MPKTQEPTITRRKPTIRSKNEGALSVEAPATHDRASSSRRKSMRRRQIDPTTCERDYSTEEREFMHAMEGYKRTSGRMFPTCSEILEVFRSLGYERPAMGSCEPLPTDATSEV